MRTLADVQPNVIHLVPSLDTGGMEQFVVSLAQHRVAQTEIVCLSHLGTLGRQLESAGFPIHVLQQSRTVLQRIRNVRALLRRRSVDILHCHNLQAFTYGAASLAGSAARQIVLTKHGTRMPTEWSIGELLRRWMARRIRLIGVSSQIQQLLSRWSRRKLSSVDMIPNGIELTSPPNGVSRHRAEFGLQDQDFVAICVARLAPEKDHATLLTGFRRLVDHAPHSRLLIVGDGELRKDLEELTKQLRLSKEVKFLGERNDARDLMRLADVAILNSTTEGTPLFLLEAMASQLPVVATAVGGVVELLDSSHGTLFQTSSADCTYEALRTALSNPAEASARAKLAYDRVTNRYSLAASLAKYESLYEQVWRPCR